MILFYALFVMNHIWSVVNKKFKKQKKNLEKLNL